MRHKLAILAGYGRLSEQVLSLASKLDGGFVLFTIKPWFRIVSEPVKLFQDVLSRSTGAKALNPFHFEQIQTELDTNGIGRIFLTGDFPRDRFVQAAIAQTFGALRYVADQRCGELFAATNPEFSSPVRYFVALEKLLEASGVRPLLASDVFPDLNIADGDNTSELLPRPIRDNLPALIATSAQALAVARPAPQRFAQAAIVDNGMVMETERSGTDDLCRRYGRSGRKKVLPFLLKMPSAEFPPALDQPTIGPETIRLSHASGLRGIVICTETTIVVDRATTLREAERLRMFLYALPLTQLRSAYLSHFPDTWMRGGPTTAQPPSDASLRPQGA